MSTDAPPSAAQPSHVESPVHVDPSTGDPWVVSPDRARRRCAALLWAARAGFAAAVGAMWLPLVTVVSFTVLVGSCNQKKAVPESRNAVVGVDVIRDRPPHGADAGAISVVHTAQPYAIALLALALIAVGITFLLPASRRRALALTGLAGAALLTLLRLADSTNSISGVHSHIGPLVTAGFGVAFVAAALLAAYPRTGLRVAQGGVFVWTCVMCLIVAPFAFGAAATAFGSTTVQPHLAGQVVASLLGLAIGWGIAAIGTHRASRKLRAHITEGRSSLAAFCAAALAMAVDMTAFGVVPNAGIIFGLVLAPLAACVLVWWMLSDQLPLDAGELMVATADAPADDAPPGRHRDAV